MTAQFTFSSWSVFKGILSRESISLEINCPLSRDLALEAAVNPNTMQKALSELERSGLVYSQRTSGRFITEDTEMLTQMKKELATEHIQEFFQKMEQLGFSRAELLTLVTKAAEGEN